MANMWQLLVVCWTSVVWASASPVDHIRFENREDQDRDLVMNRRLISAFFSAQEQECFKEEKFLYEPDKQCYPLLTTGPCNKSEGHDQWLVLEQLTDGRLRAVCRPCPCCDQPYSVFMATDRKCHHRVKERARFCPQEGTELRDNEFGEGECGCIRSPPHARLRDDPSGTCYQLYQRGPCRHGETLFPDRDPKTLEPVGRCGPDPCAKHGERYAQWKSGDGKCYRLGSQGPCDSLSKFNVHRTSRIPHCVQPTNAIVAPKDFISEAPPAANLPTVDRNFALDLLSSRSKRRAGKP